MENIGQCSLEGEIDQLLYGKTPDVTSDAGSGEYQSTYGSVSAVDDVPYATLIEDKYRTAKQADKSISNKKGNKNAARRIHYLFA